MKDIKILLRMTESPQDYTDEEVEWMMSDPDMRTYYELMVSAEAGFAQQKNKHNHGMRLWKAVAMFLGIILLSGFSFAAIRLMQSKVEGKLESPVQETRISNTYQQSEVLPQDSIRTFENRELEEILNEISCFYHVSVVFRNEQTRHIRLYTKWDTSAPLSQMIERLNSFEKVSIRLYNNQIIAE